MKILSGIELSGYITERQARQIRQLRQEYKVFPKLAIVQTIDSLVIDRYVHLKQQYAKDILAEVEVYKIDQAKLIDTIQRLNEDNAVHGIIVQLPLADTSETEQAVNAVIPAKDVDGLSEDAMLTPATAMAIDWLLAGYNVELKGKNIAIVGNGRLVGAPLARLWANAGLNVSVYDDTTENLANEIRKAQVIVTATGVPGLITSQMIQPGAVVVDAGTASENGKLIGDVAEDVRNRSDVTITPKKGGVGPLTVTALFDNLIQAARSKAEEL
ncbi:MAG: bifunctional 5,10-methylenetetrahydrofolate dehydrogenase/5,10-methenyltetrahydrofolate cyclohydrolase [Candidatus Microsaccharimonas sossegonensis]|uniref:Bifunctional protein FolD n=1 Tax=Candidatus Microsaccharimonas sossegonensis TaxID=2506948 RepID=A0A4Q0AGK6_9BACT|nr:MAG: bifunctional 5,10-methylenetetrahydrofolate dehydrogenase/5,10-methenyltetrahydrofolate cyclohydrolase [Candidatus Microsaccharimonas sossegonensis]